LVFSLLENLNRDKKLMKYTTIKGFRKPKEGEGTHPFPLIKRDIS